MAQVSQVVEIPSKWDVIPIHASDISAYKRCRRYWEWSSPTRTNLRRKVDIFGLDPKLWFGSGFHYALEQYYNPALQRDPVETFSTWFQLQWYGGVLTEDELDLTYDIRPELLPDGTYHTKGLVDLLPSPDEDEFMAYRELGIGMATFFKEWAKRHDVGFELVAAESKFSIPLGFESKDRREDSPNYGKMLEVHARGKRDAIVFRYDVERYGILEHKTAANIGEDYFRKLDKDPQVTTYLWASQLEAQLNDLPWKNLTDVFYRAYRKTAPSPPTPLKSGMPSLNRTTESTTAEMFSQYIKDNDLVLWYEENPKAQEYYEYLLREGEELFIIEEIVRRNRYEIENQGIHYRMIAEEMLNDPSIYPNPTGDWLCLGCQFRPPCIAADDGSDWQGMLDDGYERNRDR